MFSQLFTILKLSCTFKCVLRKMSKQKPEFGVIINLPLYIFACSQQFHSSIVLCFSLFFLGGPMQILKDLMLNENGLNDIIKLTLCVTFAWQRRNITFAKLGTLHGSETKIWFSTKGFLNQKRRYSSMTSNSITGSFGNLKTIFLVRKQPVVVCIDDIDGHRWPLRVNLRRKY